MAVFITKAISWLMLVAAALWVWRDRNYEPALAVLGCINALFGYHFIEQKHRASVVRQTQSVTGNANAIQAGGNVAGSNVAGGNVVVGNERGQKREHQ
jgi:hypothetical protein